MRLQGAGTKEPKINKPLLSAAAMNELLFCGASFIIYFDYLQIYLFVQYTATDRQAGNNAIAKHVNRDLFVNE